MYSSYDIAENIENWKVLKQESLSFYRYFELSGKNVESLNAGKPKCVVEEKKFRKVVLEKTSDLNLQNMKYELRDKIIQEAAISSRKNSKSKTPYWWSVEIANIREKCLAARRALTRKKKVSQFSISWLAPHPVIE